MKKEKKLKYLDHALGIASWFIIICILGSALASCSGRKFEPFTIGSICHNYQEIGGMDGCKDKEQEK